MIHALPGNKDKDCFASPNHTKLSFVFLTFSDIYLHTQWLSSKYNITLICQLFKWIIWPIKCQKNGCLICYIVKQRKAADRCLNNKSNCRRWPIGQRPFGIFISPYGQQAAFLAARWNTKARLQLNKYIVRGKGKHWCAYVRFIKRNMNKTTVTLWQTSALLLIVKLRTKTAGYRRDAAALTVPAEPLQAVSQLLTVSVEPPGFVRHLVQLLVLVFSCKLKTLEKLPSFAQSFWTLASEQLASRMFILLILEAGQYIDIGMWDSTSS